MCRLLILLLPLFFLTSVSQAQQVTSACLGNATESCYMAVSGPITKGLVARVLQEMEDFEGQNFLLNSVGGDLMEGIELGRLLRRKHFTTIVGRLVGLDRDEDRAVKPGDCLSACAIAFLGGAARSPDSATSLGFHQFHEGGARYNGYFVEPSAVRAEGISHAQIVSGIVVSYMVEMGVDARLFQKSAAAGPEEIIRLTREEAKTYGVVSGDVWGPWVMEPLRKGVIAASRRTIPVRPRDRATQVTALCEGPGGAPILLLTAEGTLLQDNGDLNSLGHGSTVYVKSGTDGLVSDFPIDLPGVKVFNSSSGLQIRIPVTTSVVDAVRQASAFSVEYLTPNAAGGYFAEFLLSDLDRDIIVAAWKLCI